MMKKAISFYQLAATNIADYERAWTKHFQSLTLDNLLITNPYLLFYAAQMSAGELVSQLLDTYLQMFEEESFKELVADISSNVKNIDREENSVAIDSFRDCVVEPFVNKSNGFHKTKAGICNLLTFEFINRFCNHDGSINWHKLIEFNSSNYDLDKFLPN
ncbi:MAG: hypothetical protein U9Q82_06690 [Chloroflexota bacterium]|nr:hypothetical protein [Chloroflexota bacterium]